MAGDLVLVERQGKVATVTLNRPEKLNALDPQMLGELREAWAEVAADDGSRVAILRGAGRAFCAGANLGGRSKAPRPIVQDRQRVLDMVQTFLGAWDLPKPVISQVHGYCFAGGTLMASLTDIIIVGEDTLIGWPRLPVGGGLIGPTWSWFVSPHRAKEFSFTIGFTMSGREAVDLGWGNRAVPAGDLERVTWEVAERIAKVPADILALKKAAHNQVMERRGFKAAVLSGAEIDAIVHETDHVRVVNKQIDTLGIKGAIDWFEREGM
jgi:enoyl-CoA hydratase